MKERPIIFSTEMVKAILDGRKSMTRRVVKPQPELTITNAVYKANIQKLIEGGDKVCPHGQIGDRLWVREAFTLAWDNSVIYRADGEARAIPSGDKVQLHWRPSIFMPRWASRLTLEITGVRVERLQEITKSSEHDKSSDIYAEGVDYMPPYSVGVFGYNIYTTFMMYWDSLNAKRGYGWDTNPWVWVIKFDNMGVRIK